jgi:MEDS: MEthanogen/methylotroph, DcmR Sensory domain
MSWRTFIETAEAGDHGVHVYARPEELGHSVQLDDEGLLILKDAEETLASLMEAGMPSPMRFEREIGGLVDEIAARFPDVTLRAFGEMMDILLARGQASAAIALEDLWNELARHRRFSLLCAYNLDIFDVGTQADALPAVFAAHSHALPALHAAQLGAAVDQALATIVGPIEAARIYLNVAEQVPRDSMPRGQAVLAWLSREDAPLAQNVLQVARANYARSH